MALFPKSASSPDRQAARRGAQEQVFLREIDDALREDDAARLLRLYGKPVAAGVVLVLAGLAGWMVWNNHVDSVKGAKGEQLTIALDQAEAGRYDTAQTNLKALQASGAAGYAPLAGLVQGGIALDRHKPADAAKAFDAVAADAGAPQAWRDLATVRSVAATFDTAPPQQVIDRLKPLAVPGNPWFGSAGELVAVALLKQGHPDKAGAMFAAIAREADAPQSLRGRARQMALQLGADPGEAPAVPGPTQAQ